mmetsp:Transcript_34145/g.77923  ORF Transcript_34145/g.77923 Transcript_34145/m.77923 type:complete len:226 (+) Transcript_34145:561-1238(+)
MASRSKPLTNSAFFRAFASGSIPASTSATVRLIACSKSEFAGHIKPCCASMGGSFDAEDGLARTSASSSSSAFICASCLQLLPSLLEVLSARKLRPQATKNVQQLISFWLRNALTSARNSASSIDCWLSFVDMLSIAFNAARKSGCTSAKAASLADWMCPWSFSSTSHTLTNRCLSASVITALIWSPMLAASVVELSGASCSAPCRPELDADFVTPSNARSMSDP